MHGSYAAKTKGHSNPPLIIPHFTQNVKGFLKKTDIFLTKFLESEI